MLFGRIAVTVVVGICFDYRCAGKFIFDKALDPRTGYYIGTVRLSGMKLYARLPCDRLLDIFKDLSETKLESIFNNRFIILGSENADA